MSIKVILLFFLFSILGVPLAVALGTASIIVLVFFSPFPLQILPQTMYVSMDSFIMVAVPLFILAGALMEIGGVSERIFGFANAIVGRWRGGLGHVNVLASMIFGGISGSSVADAASLGPIEIAAMTRHGYGRGYSAAISVASSTLAVIIPPSILLVVAGATAGESIGQLLLAGLGPGILIGLALMGANHMICGRRGYGQTASLDERGIWHTIWTTVPATISPLIIMGGILWGFFTPTEASAIAVVYTLLIAVLFYKELRWKDIPSVLLRTARTSGTILLIAVTAKVATWIFTIDGLPGQIANLITGISHQPTVVLLLIVLFLIVIGMFMDVMAALLILIPIFMPTIKMVGIDPVHFLVVMVGALAIGLVTPPVGVCLFAICNVSKLSIERVTQEVWPLVLVLIAAVVLVALVPGISLWPVHLLWR